MEKVNAFLKNEKLRSFTKKVFNKKTIISAIVIILIVTALRVAFQLMFVVQGVVSKVEGSNITVANFLTTKTVDVGSLQTSTNSIQVGDRVRIMKNLSGDVISVRDENRGRMGQKGSLYNYGKGNFKGRDGRNSMRRS